MTRNCKNELHEDDVHRHKPCNSGHAVPWGNADATHETAPRRLRVARGTRAARVPGGGAPINYMENQIVLVNDIDDIVKIKTDEYSKFTIKNRYTSIYNHWYWKRIQSKISWNWYEFYQTQEKHRKAQLILPTTQTVQGISTGKSHTNRQAW